LTPKGVVFSFPFFSFVFFSFLFFWLNLAAYPCMHLNTLRLNLAKSLHLVQAALEKEIKDTLASWQQLLACADRIFVQASVSNARPIYGGDDAALQRHDPRIRSIPFNTR